MSRADDSRLGTRNQRSLLLGLSSTLFGGLLCGPLLYAAEGNEATSPAEGTVSTSERHGGLEEVVVQARNRLEPLKDVPLSISVVTGTELQRLQAEDLGAISRRAASVSWNQGNQRTSSLSIRGVGKVGQTEAQDPSVGVGVDGVSYAYNPLWNHSDPGTYEDTQPAYVISILLDKTLTLNFDIFHTEIKDYQRGVQVFDEYTTTLRNDGTIYYTASTGNAPKVEVQRCEVQVTSSSPRCPVSSAT